MMKILLAAAGAAFLVVAPALAADSDALTTDEATRFVATLEDAQALGAEMKTEGKSAAINVKSKPKPGEPFKPYSKAVSVMKAEYPADYARLGALAKSQGFTAEEWGATGDKVILAYLAARMDRESPGAMAQMKSMDKSYLDMMPPNMKAQMEGAFALMEAVENTPPENRKAIEPLMDDIDAVMDKSEKE